LLREEFRLLKLILQSELRRRAASRRALPCPSSFLTFFPEQLGIFSPNFMCLLHVPIYTRIQSFIQLSTTVTKLCHIKCDHLACVSADGGHFEHMMVVALNMA